jgi:hypothetical protein
VTTPLASPTTIAKAGVYDIPAETYHADPVEGGSLSSSGAKLLLAPSCPAKFRYAADNGEIHKRIFDFGHAAHREVLGAGADLVVVHAKDWRTNAAQQQRDEAYAAGKTPILVAEHDKAKAMAAAVRAHPLASRLLSPEYVTPEQTLVWFDKDAGIWCRAMLDGLPLRSDRRMIIPDYKTAASAEPRALSKAVNENGYHCQAPWYVDGIRTLGLDDDPAFVFICQEKTPPYLITIVQPDEYALDVGRQRNRKARHVYAKCRATNTWPTYADDVISIGLPPWASNQHEAALLRGDYDIEEAS